MAWSVASDEEHGSWIDNVMTSATREKAILDEIFIGKIQTTGCLFKD